LKWVLGALLTALLIGAAGVGGLAVRLRAAYAPADPLDARQVELDLDNGLSGKQIASKLEAAGIIRSARWFLLVARREGKDGRFKAGDYVFGPDMPALDIIDALVEGRSQVVPVTFPEGYTLKQMAARLEELELLEADAFLAAAEAKKPTEVSGWQVAAGSLEGYLFPDTYFIPRKTTPEQVIGMMLERFGEVALAEYGQEIREGRMSLAEVVTLASIIEWEAQLAEERPIVAQVFLSRLDLGWRLESCATVQYLLGERKPVLTAKEQAIDSPYNTYKYAGLPPGPIGNPGKASIEAVLRPAKTDYLFFRTRGDGGHHFSHTFEEHLAAGR